MSTEEKQIIIETNEALIERFEKQAEEATTEVEECTALGLLEMVTQHYEQIKRSW